MPTRRWGTRCRIDGLDEYLESIGLFRKQIARDATCLFRCVAEQCFLSQTYHETVKKECIRFLSEQKGMFEEVAKRLGISYSKTLEKLRKERCYTGGILEMWALGLLYSRDFAIYHLPDHEFHDPAVNATPQLLTNHGFQDFVVLGITNENHYDSVYSAEHIEAEGLCQSIVYELVFEEIFEMPGCVEVADYMLRGQTEASLNEPVWKNFSVKAQTWISKYFLAGVLKPPFRFKDAKALVPYLYRNVEFDLWIEEVRAVYRHTHYLNEDGLGLGTRCLVYLNESEPSVCGLGYIQNMIPNKGPVTVFVESLGQIRTLPYSRVKPMPLNCGKHGNEERSTSYHSHGHTLRPQKHSKNKIIWSRTRTQDRQTMSGRTQRKRHTSDFSAGDEASHVLGLFCPSQGQQTEQVFIDGKGTPHVLKEVSMEHKNQVYPIASPQGHGCEEQNGGYMMGSSPFTMSNGFPPPLSPLIQWGNKDNPSPPSDPAFFPILPPPAPPCALQGPYPPTPDSCGSHFPFPVEPPVPPAGVIGERPMIPMDGSSPMHNEVSSPGPSPPSSIQPSLMQIPPRLQVSGLTYQRNLHIDVMSPSADSGYGSVDSSSRIRSQYEGEPLLQCRPPRRDRCFPSGPHPPEVPPFFMPLPPNLAIPTYFTYLPRNLQGNAFPSFTGPFVAYIPEPDKTKASHKHPL